MNRRLAEHKNRKGISVVPEDASEDGQTVSSSKAAAAAARVAARYAKTPSFSDMQAAEARGALRAAEAATKVALEAQAAAQAVLDRIQNGGEERTSEYESQAIQTPVQPRQAHKLTSSSGEAAAEAAIEIRWEPDLPARPAAQQHHDVTYPWEMPSDSAGGFDGGYIYESVEAAQDIPANLIEFPREIIATRRLRPRIGEEQADSTDPHQLSIFEVEPDSVSTSPMASSVAAAQERTWIGSSWQQIELEEQPQRLPDYYAIVPDDAPKLYQAPFGRRMMATLVDTALILSLACGAAYLVASRFDHLPGIRVSEVCGVIATLGLAALYEWFFLTYAKVTPGMRYAQLSLCTFDEEVPNALQVKGRLKAMLISVLPVGLGMVWSIFDEDQMSWHDRLSKTYLRLS
ncbi:RDD family protein [Telmatobacter sp. DSM 110680]|uniref:RDD family protein n=1 Tax=Telmatobacter sp. DSM 110680 TaxID=3036704 RepID=A0AAU7DR65_9BACT